MNASSSGVRFANPPKWWSKSIGQFSVVCPYVSR